jgi:hypothetical protein
MKAPYYEIISCVVCNAEVLEHKLDAHIEAVHQCKLCGFIPHSPESLDVHMDFWHKDETDKAREDAHGD